VFIPLGVLLFKLRTAEEKYTSMEYLSPSNFKRGNDYMHSQYSPLVGQLRKAIRKISQKYERECERLLDLTVPKPEFGRGAAAGNPGSGQQGGSPFLANTRNENDTPSSHLYYAPASHNCGASSRAEVQTNYGSRASGYEKFQTPGRQRVEPRPTSMAHPPVAGGLGPIDSPVIGSEQSTPAVITHSRQGTLSTFDANRYSEAQDEAQQLSVDLAAIKSLTDFLHVFIKVRKILVVFYRLVATTGPVLESEDMAALLDKCECSLDAITPQTMYRQLYDNIRYEVGIMRCIVSWDESIAQYNFLKAVTAMSRAKTQLRAWGDSLPPIGQPREPPAANKTPNGSIGRGSIYDSISGALSKGSWEHPDKEASAGANNPKKFLLSAFAKSTRMVQSLIWGSDGSGSGMSEEDIKMRRMRFVYTWISSWTEHLAIKTTVYFQQIIAPHRSLYHDDLSLHARHSAIMEDIWSRPSMAKFNLNDLATTFLHANDGLFVVLLLESSKERPFCSDGFAMAGTKIKVPETFVQSYAMLFCITNQPLMRSHGYHLRDSLSQDIHTSAPDPDESLQALDGYQLDAEWFRRKCLPDFVSILEGDAEPLDTELLRANPMVTAMGNDAERLLAELDSSIDEICAATHAVDDESGVEIADGKHEAESSVMQPMQSAISETIETIASNVRQSAANDPTRQRAESDPQSKTATAAVDHHATPIVHLNDEAEDIARLGSSLEGAESAEENGHHQLVGLEHEDGHEFIGDPSDEHIEGHSLYSTYLLKSHLRNNQVATAQSKQGRGRRLVERKTSKGSRFADTRPQQSSIQYQRCASLALNSETAGGSAEHSQLEHCFGSAVSVPTGHVSQAMQVKYATVGSRDSKPGRTREPHRCGSGGFSLSELANEIQKSDSASEAVPLGSCSTAKTQAVASMANATTSDAGSMRRIRSGGRLREMAAPLKLTLDNASRTYSPQKRHTDASSIHSLTLSTPTRASFGAKSGRAAMAAMVAEPK
ncbi:hypothetical protein EC988_002916, partial [Linderina pennispora]